MLTYIGNGAFDPRFPARDLSAEEVAAFGKDALLATGLYREPDVKKTAPASKTINKQDIKEV
jgi:hypothetical protein